MKKTIMSMTLFALVFIAANMSAAQSVSKSYQISVHIPAIAGVNVPLDDPNAEIRPEEIRSQLTRDVRQVVRAGQPIILETILLK